MIQRSNNGFIWRMEETGGRDRLGGWYVDVCGKEREVKERGRLRGRLFWKKERQ
jgi:hypothetical protein